MILMRLLRLLVNKNYIINLECYFYTLPYYKGGVFLAKMTSEEKKQWDDLYWYVKKEIMLYEDNQALPNNIVLRLKGLTPGKLMANNKTENNAKYTYETVLYTFKMCKSAIMIALYGKTFKSEMSKFIYVAAIVENNINDVYLRIENAKKAKEKTEVINIDTVYHNGAEYIRKTDDNVNKKLEGLW